MSRRAVALLVCRLIEAALPLRAQSWARAVRHEVEAIADDGEALRFAVHGLLGLAPRALAAHLLQPFAALAAEGPRRTGGINDMAFCDMMHRPRAIAVACAVGAALLGIAYMAAAGAPVRYAVINAGALVLGLVAVAGLWRMGAGRWPGAVTLAMALALLATALLGIPIEGASRWVQLGPLSVQPSLVLLPAMLVGFARSRGPLSLLGMTVAAAALATQPDRGMAGMLAAGLSVLAFARPDSRTLPAAAAAAVAFVITLLRPDTLPAVPFVDQILYASFDVHLLAGTAVLGGVVLLFVPPVLGSIHDPEHRVVHVVFGASWAAAFAAAALGNYPTPIVGYGGSAILGYLLSLTALPAAARPARDATAAAAERRPQEEEGRLLRIAAVLPA